MTIRPSDTAVALTVDPEGIQDGKEQDAGPRQDSDQRSDLSEPRLFHLLIHMHSLLSHVRR